jgi:hypothetical protein
MRERSICIYQCMIKNLIAHRHTTKKYLCGIISTYIDAVEMIDVISFRPYSTQLL